MATKKENAQQNFLQAQLDAALEQIQQLRDEIAKNQEEIKSAYALQDAPLHHRTLNPNGARRSNVTNSSGERFEHTPVAIPYGMEVPPTLEQRIARVLNIEEMRKGMALGIEDMDADPDFDEQGNFDENDEFLPHQFTDSKYVIEDMNDEMPNMQNNEAIVAKGNNQEPEAASREAIAESDAAPTTNEGGVK